MTEKLSDGDIVELEDAAVSSAKGSNKQDQIQLNRMLMELNKRFAFTIYGDSAVILKIDEDKVRFFPETTFLSLLRNKKYFVVQDQKFKPIGPAWLGWEGRRSYDDVIFYPGQTGTNIFNLWKGYAYQPKEGNCSLFLDHIRANICGGDEKNYSWILDWMADAVQKPYRKNWTAVLMESKEEGTGKGFFAATFGALFGRHYAAFNKPKQLLGQFNSHLEDKLIIFLDEGSLVEKNAYDYAKSLITEPTLNIEPKGRSMREVNSFHRIIMASNDRYILRASLYDRRWMVFRVQPNSVNNLGYFREIENQMKSGGYEALMYLLVNRKYEDDTVKTTIKTAALNYQKEQNLSPVLRWWRGCLITGSIGLLTWPIMSVETKEMYNAYIRWCDEMKINERQSVDWLPRRLNEEAGMKFKSLGGGGGARFYDLPELDYCRQAFDDAVGYITDWEG